METVSRTDPSVLAAGDEEDRKNLALRGPGLSSTRLVVGTQSNGGPLVTSRSVTPNTTSPVEDSEGSTSCEHESRTGNEEGSLEDGGGANSGEPPSAWRAKGKGEPDLAAMLAPSIFRSADFADPGMTGY